MDKVICCVACLLIGGFIGFVSTLAGLNKIRPDLYDELKREAFDERHDQPE